MNTSVDSAFALLILFGGLPLMWVITWAFYRIVARKVSR